MWARRKQRTQHCDAPGMEITVEEAEDGSAPTGLVRALDLWKLKAPRWTWTRLYKKQKPEEGRERTFRCDGLAVT